MAKMTICILHIRVPKTVLLVNRAFVPPEKGGFWRKWRKWRICILTSKTRALLLEPRETTKMTKMAGVPRARAWFTKSTVSWTPKCHTKTRGCAPQSPETDENDENSGCPSDKTRVCQKLATPLASYRWEMSPKSEMAEKWPAAIFRGRPEMAGKMAGQMAGQAENGQISAIRPFFRPFRAFPEKWPPAISPAISDFGLISHLWLANGVATKNRVFATLTLGWFRMCWLSWFSGSGCCSSPGF